MLIVGTLIEQHIDYPAHTDYHFAVSFVPTVPVVSYSDVVLETIIPPVGMLGPPAGLLRIYTTGLPPKNLLFNNGTQATAAFAVAGTRFRAAYDVTLDAFVVEDGHPITDDVLREKGLIANYKVELAVGGNLVQALNADGERTVTATQNMTEDNSFPTSKAIDGNRSPMDYDLDVENAYCKAYCGSFTENNAVVIDFGKTVSITEVVIYQHPDEPTLYGGGKTYIIPAMDMMLVCVAPDGAAPPIPYNQTDWTIIANARSGDLDATGTLMYRTKMVLRLGKTYTGRYLAVVIPRWASPTPPTSPVLLVEVEAYNYVDLTPYVLWNENGPRVDMTFANDQSQTPIPTPSDCQVVLANVDGRFNPGNSSSPYYGTEQMDGDGSGIRQGVPVRVTARIQGADGLLRMKRRFDGIVLNDQTPTGPMAVQLDDAAKEATLVCKGIACMIGQEVDTPAYEGMFLKPLFEDLCARSGIAKQDTNSDEVFNAVQWAALGRTTGLAAAAQMSKALPFLRVSEKHDPATMSMTNKGRTRGDLDFTRFNPAVPAAPYLYGSWYYTGYPVLTVLHHENGGPFHYVFKTGTIGGFYQVGDGVVFYDQRKSVGDSAVVSSATPTTCAIWRNIRNNVLYEINPETMSVNDLIANRNPTMRSASLTDDDQLLSWTNHGYVDPSSVYGVATNYVRSAIQHGSNIFMLAGRGSYHMFVWDTSGPYAGKVDKGAVPSYVQSATVISVTEVGLPTGLVRCVMANDDYWAASYKGGGVDGTKVAVWNHAGDPVANPMTFVNRDYFSFGAIGPLGENYEGAVRYFLDADTLYAAAQPIKANGLARHEIWSVPIADLTAGTATATLLGVLADDVSQEITDLTAKDGYVYVLTRYNLTVWDTTKDVARAFDLGTPFNYIPNETNLSTRGMSRVMFAHQGMAGSGLEGVVNVNGNPYHSYMSGMGLYHGNDCGSTSPSIDADGKVWVVLGPLAGGTATGPQQARVFSVSPQQFDLTPSTTFAVGDGVVETMDVVNGAPDANQITMRANPYSIGPAPISLWAQQDPLTFPAGELTTTKIRLNTFSSRGYGFDRATRRYLSFPGTFRKPAVGMPTVDAPVTQILVPGHFPALNPSGWGPTKNHIILKTVFGLTGNFLVGGVVGSAGMVVIIDNQFPGSDVTLVANDPACINPAYQFHMPANVVLPKKGTLAFFWDTVLGPGWYPIGLSIENQAWDDPLSTVFALFEGAYRPIKFWALGDSAFIQIDNRGTSACVLTGASIWARPIQQSYSNSPAIEQEDEPSVRLYSCGLKKPYALDVSSAWTNDPTSLRDHLQAKSRARKWIAPTKLAAWWPILEPGDVVALTHADHSMSALPCEVQMVRFNGFVTEFNAREVPDRFVI